MLKSGGEEEQDASECRWGKAKKKPRIGIVVKGSVKTGRSFFCLKEKTKNAAEKLAAKVAAVECPAGE